MVMWVVMWVVAWVARGTARLAESLLLHSLALTHEVLQLVEQLEPLIVHLLVEVSG